MVKSRSGSGGLIVYFDAISAEWARFPVTAAGFRTEPVWIQTQKKKSRKESRIIPVLLETGWETNAAESKEGHRRHGNRLKVSRGRLCRRNMFFSGAVTSSPIRRRLRSEACQSLDVSLLSPDSSYICHPSADGSQLCSCRRSPRLLTNGYYSVTEDSFSWDHDGNVSLTPCKTSVSYKERLVRVFRRRRRPTGALARLLSDVTEGCQSWLDEKVFRGVFTAEGDQNHLWDRTGPESDQLDKSTWSELDKSTWSELDSADLDKGHGFTYDHTEAPPPPGKMTPPPTVLIQEEIGAEICQSKQTLAGLAEVPPPSHLYTGGSCGRVSPEHTGVTMTTVLLSIFVIFIVAAVNSGCLLWSAAVAAGASGLITTFACLTKSGPAGRWRRAKTEDISSRNE